MATAWMHRAACRDVDPELFFPVAAPGTERYVGQVRAAKAACAPCPVLAECLAFALVLLPVGVAGGLDEFERAEVRRAGARSMATV